MVDIFCKYFVVIVFFAVQPRGTSGETCARRAVWWVKVRSDPGMTVSPWLCRCSPSTCSRSPRIRPARLSQSANASRRAANFHPLLTRDHGHTPPTAVARAHGSTRVSSSKDLAGGSNDQVTTGPEHSQKAERQACSSTGVSLEDRSQKIGNNRCARWTVATGSPGMLSRRLPPGRRIARQTADASPQRGSVLRVRSGPDHVSAASVQEAAGES